jgi:hypothetical protein
MVLFMFNYMSWGNMWLFLYLCWLRRLIGSYIRSWERPGDLPRVIEILCLFASGAQRNERKDDNLCKLVTDQWQASLWVRDSESCWFTEEIGTYMRCWENLGDLPRVIEILCLFASGAQRNEQKETKISITSTPTVLNICVSFIFSFSYF